MHPLGTSPGPSSLLGEEGCAKADLGDIRVPGPFIPRPCQHGQPAAERNQTRAGAAGQRPLSAAGVPAVGLGRQEDGGATETKEGRHKPSSRSVITGALCLERV